ncbi:unnamed protein product [Ectocarpus sp. 8 AP-2014]
MPSPAFGLFFEIFSEGVVFTVALITSVCFGERCWKRSAPLNITGLAASLIAVSYSVFALEYWFNGLGDLYDCTTLAARRQRKCRKQSTYITRVSLCAARGNTGGGSSTGGSGSQRPRSTGSR